MRTTLELPDHLRAQLLELAARRGLKGFSVLVQEAVERYLAEVSGGSERIRGALDVLGTLDDADADALEQSIDSLRGRWR